MAKIDFLNARETGTIAPLIFQVIVLFLCEFGQGLKKTMTAVYAIPVELERLFCFFRPLTRESDISVVIPVYNDATGLKRTLNSLQLAELKSPIFVIDDGSNLPVHEELRSIVEKSMLNCTLVRISQNCGAGHARNLGVQRAETSWVSFLDCDCDIAGDYFEVAINALNASSLDTVALCGPVKSKGTGTIACYMEEQGILNPPLSKEGRPQALITANAVVLRAAIEFVDGFDESFPSAGGEDIDLGIRLTTVGNIAYEPTLIVRHNFLEDMKVFKERFRRYGKAAKLLETKWKVDWSPKGFASILPELQHLADIQYAEMLKGYECKA